MRVTQKYNNGVGRPTYQLATLLASSTITTYHYDNHGHKTQ